MYKILVNDILICDSRIEELALINPVIKLEENKAGSFSFKIPPKHPYYDLIERRKSVIQVHRDEELVFSGMCIEISNDFYKQKEIYCEGELAYLNDSIQRPARYQGVTVRGLLEAFIANHNAQVEEEKQFEVGMVTVTDANDYLYCYTNMQNTLICLKEDLTDNLGGFFRIRHDNGIKYIDYLHKAQNTNSQIIKLGENLIDFSSNINSSEIATAVIPLGTKLEQTVVEGLEPRLTIESVNEGRDFVYSEDAVNTYGWIYAVVEWDDVTTATALKSKGEKYLSDIQFENIVIKAKAIDLHLSDSTVEMFSLSDDIRVWSSLHGLDRYFRLTQMTINLNHPEDDTITLGKEENATLSAKTNSENAALKNTVSNIRLNSILEQAVLNATQLIKNVMNGYVTTILDDVGTPTELLIMDSPDINTAQKVWRWNINGLGYSNTGYNGEYALAMTMDGAFVADFITTGVLNASLIKAGILSDKTGENYFNLETGEFRMSSSVKVGQSTVASRQDVTDAAGTAERNANTATDNKLKDYSTTEQSKQYADSAAQNAANNAEENANAATDEKLKSYATTTEMQSAIKQSADSIDLEVSKKVGNGEIISKINQTAETVKISAERIDVDGVLDAEKIEALEIKSKHVEVVNEEGKQTGKWDADGFMAQTDSYKVTETFPKYFENNYYSYPYYDTYDDHGNKTGQGDYIASYIIELEDASSEHTVYVKFKNPNIDTSHSMANTGCKVNVDNIYSFTALNGQLILTVSNWFGDADYSDYITEQYYKASILYGDVEKIWSPAAGIKRVSVSTGGGGSGAVNAVKYSYDNEAVKTGVSGMEINTEEGTIKSDHYIIDEDGVNFQLDNYIGSGMLEDSRVNRMNMNKDGFYMTAFEVDRNNNMTEYKFMEFLTSLYEAGIKFSSPHTEGSPECYFGVAGIKNTAVGKTTTSGGANVRVTADGNLYKYASSSKRYKKDITTELSEDLAPERLYDLNVVQYKYNDGYLEENDERCGRDFIGFIAEEVMEKYPLACNVDGDGRPEMWEVNILFPALLKLVQDQKKQIDILDKRITELEGGNNG